MTNKYMYFIANWKMFGTLKSVNSLSKVIKYTNSLTNRKFKLIYCPPFTLLDKFNNKLKNTNIEIGGQNCHHSDGFGSFTGFVSPKMLKDCGAKYVILGHSENRQIGENDKIINLKIKNCLKNNLKVILCVGETFTEKKQKKTKQIISSQIIKGLKKIKDTKNIIIAYEPVWSIGTGKLLSTDELSYLIEYIKKILKSRYKVKKTKVLYGGSVKTKNIDQLKKIDILDGFLIGGASRNPQNLIDIVKKSYI